MSGLDDYNQTVADFSKSVGYKNWKSKNVGEFGKWAQFDKAIKAGQTPTPPTLITWFGKGIVDAGVQYLNTLSVTPPAPEVSGGLVGLYQLGDTLSEVSHLDDGTFTGPIIVTQDDATSGLLAKATAQSGLGFVYCA